MLTQHDVCGMQHRKVESSCLVWDTLFCVVPILEGGGLARVPLNGILVFPTE